MRRRGTSPWLIEQQCRIRRTTPMGVEHCIAAGDHPLEAWRVDRAMPISKLSKLTGIEVWHLMDIDSGWTIATVAEVDAIAVALLVEPDLLQRQTAEANLSNRFVELRRMIHAARVYGGLRNLSG